MAIEIGYRVYTTYHCDRFGGTKLFEFIRPSKTVYTNKEAAEQETVMLALCFDNGPAPDIKYATYNIVEVDLKTGEPIREKDAYYASL